VVAVLEKRGRFLTAERLFPERRVEDGPPRRRGGGARMVVGAAGGRGGGRAGAGDLVLLGQPSPGKGHWRVLRVVGRPDVARDVIEGLMLDRGLSREFAPAVEREAREAGARPPAVERGGAGRRDLRELATLTIDPITARDFDDAISAERLPDGGVRVWVHIADVSAHVPEGSLVDREARRRATSVYVPGAVEPMLPHALSNDACSLLPGAERRAVTVELDLHGATVARSAFYRSLIRSDARLSYEDVDEIFAGTRRAQEPWGTPLQAAREAAAALGAARLAHGGALTLESPEPEFTFDERGHVREIGVRAQTESHRVIEHLMIAANEAVARLLAERGVPCLYRVHERPQPERVERLVEQLASLGVPTPPTPERMSSTQAAELVGELSRRVDRHVRRSGRGRGALSSLVLRALRQASYSPKNIGHAGLGTACYCHFTSPIRRYPDLVCHRALTTVLDGGAPTIGGPDSAPRAGELQELGAWTSEREREAMTIERDADDVARCFALEQVLYDGGWERTFAGEVIGLISAGAFVAFGDGGASAAEDGRQAPARASQAGDEAGDRAPQAVPPYEGMLPVRRMRTEDGRDWWELNEPGTILSAERSGATLRLGDPIDVRVARVDSPRGRVDLLPAGQPAPRGRGG